jgi:APA family basic amino acid/polyamine antiporter
MRENLQRVGLAGKSVADISATAKVAPLEALNFLKAAAFLFFAYIGFASISQAGGETRNPRRSLPWAFVAATTVICTYYLLFSSAVYHAIPWRFIAGFTEAAPTDVSVPLLIGVLMPPALASFVALMAGMALANDIPPMLMATSRLFFAWARDGVFPRGLAAISRRFRTPHWALTMCALVATLWVILCAIEEDYFAGVDTVVMALTFTYILICVSVLSLPRCNPDICQSVSFLRSRRAQIAVSCIALAFLCPLLVLAVLIAGTKSVIFWLAALAAGALIYTIMWFRAKARGEDLREVFAHLPTASEQLELTPEPEVED